MTLDSPYQRFGKIVHLLRRKHHETRRELCDALEISTEQLDRIEQGADKPTEELVELVVNHFDLDDNLATNLWVLAGYPAEKLEDIAVQTALLPASELRITYTDTVHVAINSFGVVINFMQTSGTGSNHHLVVSRLGMSKEHAKSLVDVLTSTLQSAELGNYNASVPKLIGEGSPSKKNTSA